MERPSIRERLLSNKSAVIGLCLTGLLALMAAVGAFTPKSWSYDQNRGSEHAKPSAEHWLGTDRDGRDILWRIVRGSMLTLACGAGAVGIALAAGVPLGLASGYFGGWLDMAAMRAMDLLLAFPPLLLALALVAALGTSLVNAVIAIGIVYTPHFARVIRSSTLQARAMDYVAASEVTGCSTPRIIFRHIFPNTVSPIVVLATTSLSSAILEIAALSFLGLGSSVEPEWGNMMSEAKNYWTLYPHTIVFPGLALSLAVFGINLLGDGLRDVLDVRLKE